MDLRGRGNKVLIQLPIYTDDVAAVTKKISENYVNYNKLSETRELTCQVCTIR